MFFLLVFQASNKPSKSKFKDIVFLTTHDLSSDQLGPFWLWMLFFFPREWSNPSRPSQLYSGMIFISCWKSGSQFWTHHCNGMSCQGLEHCSNGAETKEMAPKVVSGFGSPMEGLKVYNLKKMKNDKTLIRCLNYTDEPFKHLLSYPRFCSSPKNWRTDEHDESDQVSLNGTHFGR